MAENLIFAARIRLPASWSITEKDDFANNIIKVLNLDHVRDTIIGDESTRGVSGGQRKRVNIGLELCAAPVDIVNRALC